MPKSRRIEWEKIEVFDEWSTKQKIRPDGKMQHIWSIWPNDTNEKYVVTLIRSSHVLRKTSLKCNLYDRMKEHEIAKRVQHDIP